MEKAAPHRDVGDITAPNMVRARDWWLSQQVGGNPVLWVLLAGVWPFVGGLLLHDTHQSTHTVTASMEPVSRQVGCDLSAAEERVFREHTINLIHPLQ